MKATFEHELVKRMIDEAVKAEREACAKLLETTDLSGLKDNPAIQSWVAEMLLAYVKAIRARGQA
jgi:Asp-tRNA(Asn)/Glu-tRNA(Gln) amidotransferase B subunit